MPIYEYEAEGKPGCDACTGRIEAFQKMSDPPLTKCEQCGGPIVRVISTPCVHESTASMLSNKNLASKGFTKYVKAGDGHYEKTAGAGPKVIKR